MLAHRTPQECELPADYAAIKVTPDDVADFARLILTRSEAQALDCIESMRIKGAPIESIYLDLLAPAARYLGEMWEEDLCDFTDVTIGLGRLQVLGNARVQILEQRRDLCFCHLRDSLTNARTNLRRYQAFNQAREEIQYLHKHFQSVCPDPQESFHEISWGTGH